MFLIATGDATVSATEVVLFGLTVVVPLMDVSLLQFPSLCNQYYSLIAFVSELRPDKVLELPPSLLDMILSSVHFGLSRFADYLLHSCVISFIYSLQ